MKIGFAGCSFTWGSELKNREKIRYSFLTSTILKAEEVNVAEPGTSNDIICKNIFETVNTTNIDFFVVQVTSILRFSLVYKDEYSTVIPAFHKGVEILSWASSNYNKERVFNFFKKHVYSSNTKEDKWYHLSRWKIITVHNYLKSLGIKHIFVFKNGQDLRMFMQDDMVPNSFKVLCCNDSLLRYCKDNNLPLGERMHPLERAQVEITKNIIIPKIKEVL